MDGNGRWAEKRGLSRIEGHRAGLEAARKIIRYLCDLGLDYITLYSFSTENWRRPTDEVKELLKLTEESLAADYDELQARGIRLRHLGRLDRLPSGLQRTLRYTLEMTKNNTGTVLSLAFDYGGRAEIVDAARRIIKGGLAADSIDETLFSRYLYTAGLPDVDLVVRTSGEMRLSNFLLWQSAYSELYFTDVLWPDFGQAELDKALADYSRRERRFGGL